MASPRKKVVRRSPVAAEAVGELGEALLEVHRHLDLEEQLQVVLEQTMARSGADLGFVFGPGDDHRVLVPFAGSIPESDPRYRALQRLEHLQMDAWLEGAHRSYQGLGPFANLAHPWPTTDAALSAAFRLTASDGQIAGLLWLLFEREPDGAAIERVKIFVDRVSVALGNALRVKAMRDLVIKDDTARCFNRRYFEEFLPEELARASRFRSPLSLIFFDLDNLKEINSKYGHATGSRMLLEVSVRVRSKIRKFDKLFRFGGDEFCIVLPETEWHGALEVAERVRESVAGQAFPAGPEGSGQHVSITASLGVASFPLHARDKEDLVLQSDRAMQRIKSSSKNAVGVAEILGGEHGT